MLINQEARQIYEAWVAARVDYEDATDPLMKGVYAAESQMLLQMYINATDN